MNTDTMNTNNNTALAVLPKAIAKVQPKPTKAELIEAMAQRKFEKQKEALDKAAAALKEATAALDAATEVYFKKAVVDGTAKPEWHRYYADWRTNTGERKKTKLQSITVQYETEAIPEEIEKLFVKKERLQSAYTELPCRDIAVIRREIREQLAGKDLAKPNRWQQFLADPDTSKAIDKMLSALSGSTATAITT